MVLFHLLLIFVSKIVLIGQSFMKNLVFWNKIFFKNGYPLPFIDTCFKTFVENSSVNNSLKVNFLFVINKQTKLRKYLKGLRKSWILQIVFKSQRKLSNIYRFKDRLPFNLVSGVVYKYVCGRCISTYYDEIDGYLIVGFGEHSAISITFDI